MHGFRRLLHFREEQEAAKPAAERRTVVTLSYDEYNVVRAELLDSVRGERRAYLDLILPTAGQIFVMAGNDWNMALRLVGLPLPGANPQRAISLFTLMDHFYNSEGRVPNYGDLRETYGRLDISVPRHPLNWEPFLTQWRADRATRDLETPPDGPPEEKRLGQDELDALLEGAQRLRHRGAWTPELIEEKFSEYVAKYDGIVSLGQRHYKAVREETGWPSWEHDRRQGHTRPQNRLGRDGRARTAAARRR